MTTPLATAKQLESTLHTALHSCAKDSPELAIYADALLHLQRCLEVLEKLPQPRYRMLNLGETLQEGDEFLSSQHNEWHLSHMVSKPIDRHSVGYYRRPIVQTQDFRVIDTFLGRANSEYAQGTKE